MRFFGPRANTIKRIEGHFRYEAGKRDSGGRFSIREAGQGMFVSYSVADVRSIKVFDQEIPRTWSYPEIREHDLVTAIEQTGARAAGVLTLDNGKTRLVGNLSILSSQPLTFALHQGTLTHQFDFEELANNHGQIEFFLDLPVIRQHLRVNGIRPENYARILTSHPIGAEAIELRDREQLIQALSKAGSLTNQPAFYEYFQKYPELVSTFLNKWYEDRAPEIEPYLQSLRPKDRALLLDPGIVAHLDTFLPFYHESITHDPALGPLALRQSFSALLGSEVVYRGMMLTPDQLEEINNSGIRAGVFRPSTDITKQHQLHALLNLFDQSTKAQQAPLGGFQSGSGHVEGLFQAIRGHIANQTYQTPFVSVSEFRQVSEMAAWSTLKTNGKRASQPGSLYVYKLRVPKLDLIRFEGIFDATQKFWRQRNKTYQQLNANKTIFEVAMSDPRVELLIFNSTAQIEGVEEYPLSPRTVGSRRQRSERAVNRNPKDEPNPGL